EMCVSLAPMFNHLEPAQMNAIMQPVRSKTFKNNEMLYHAGEDSDSLYIVHHVRIKRYRLSESGKAKLTPISPPGDITGELTLLQADGVHEAYAEALSAADVCVIERQDLQDLLLKYPSISLKVLQEFSNRLEDTERQSTSFATENVEMRIAHFLVE